MNALERQRELAHRMLLTLAWAHVAVVAGVAALSGTPWLLLGGAAFAAAALATIVRALGPDPRAVRATIAMALMAQISLLVAALNGAAWQVDAHMYYFACLALIGFYCDAVAVIAAAGLVAVQHLGLNFLLPAALYPGGADFGRVLIHAVVVVIESAGLIFMGEAINRAFVASDAALAAASEAQARVEHAMQEAESLRAADGRHADDRERVQAEALAEQAEMANLLGVELARVADGDLSARVTGDLKGAYARLKGDFNGALDQLKATLQEARHGASGMRSQLGVIDEVAADMARRAEAQSGQLAQVASSVGEMVVLVERAAAGASRAREVVSAADGDAKRSSLVVGQAIGAMGAITESAVKIGGIIGAIDEIAFQTNLLALNASVEAARAGESGRGFAVVASEVRALAQRSAQAAREIKDLISSSVSEVESGAALVRETGEALERIVGRVAEIAGVVVEITAGATSQSQRISDIDGAVREMERSTHDSVQMSERASSVSSTLAQESENLERLIGRFRFDGNEAGQRRRAA